MKKIPILLGCVLLAACSNDDELRIGDILTTTFNPSVYIYIEDTGGNDLLQRGEPINVVGVETGEPISYDLHSQQRLPWGGTGTLLAFQPATPYHDPYDRDYVYTIDPHTAVQLGNYDAIVLQRTFDYDYQRHAHNGQQDVSVSYVPDRTVVNSYTMKSDTLHIIMESGYPNLRVEGSLFTVEMRFPAVSGPLASLPLIPNAEGEWENDLLRFRLLFSGRTIAKPHETATVALRTEHTTTADGQHRNETFLALTVSLPLPYLYEMSDMEGFHTSQFLYDYLVSSPVLFGDDYEHSFNLNAFDQYGNGKLQFWRIEQDGHIVDTPTLAGPNHLIVDWRK